MRIHEVEAPPLGGPRGAPSLKVIVTNNACVIEQWIAQHVLNQHGAQQPILGFDTETRVNGPSGIDPR